MVYLAGCGSKVNRKQSRNSISASTTSTQLMWHLISPLPQRLFWSTINFVVKKWKVKIKQDHTMHNLHWFFCCYDGTKMKWKRIKVLTIKQVRSLHEQQHKDCCLLMSMENFNPILSRNYLNHQQDFIREKITKIKGEKIIHHFQKKSSSGKDFFLERKKAVSEIFDQISSGQKRMFLRKSSSW